MSDYIFSLDIGTRTVIGTVGVLKNKKFHVVREFYVEHEERAMIDGQIHDIELVAKAVEKVKKNLEKGLKATLSKVAIAAAGRFLKTIEVNCEINIDSDKVVDKDIIRSLELTAVKKAEEEVQKSTEGRLYCVGHSVKSYYLNGFVISNLLGHKGEAIGTTVIATFLPRSVVDSLYSVMKLVDLNVSSLTLEPIAAMEAAIPKKLRLLNIALVDIGAGTSDIAICSNESISAFGMVSIAGDEVTEIIAKEYLVDFNSAEKIKREIDTKDVIEFVDILGFDGTINKTEILKVIKPIVEKLAEEIATRIIDLNGGKTPSAIFLVGGGAHTPTLKELIASKVNLPTQRVAIKGRESVTDCVCKDMSLGSTGVTVLGIALDVIKKSGNNFIDVSINENVVSLFNYHKHSVMDVIVAAGINPKMMMAKNGKNIKFILNDDKRVAFGSIAKNATILINGKIGSLDSEIIEGDGIKIDYAQDGVNAKPKIFDYIKEVGVTSFYFNDELTYLEPIPFKNNEVVKIKDTIKENDNIEIIYPTTIREFKTYKLDYKVDNYKFFINNIEVSKEYTIREGDKIYFEIGEEDKDTDAFNREIQPKPIEFKLDENLINENNFNISVNINGENIIVKGKEKFVFIDIFQVFEYDLTAAKGMVKLLLNGNKVGFYDEIKDGDKIEIIRE